MHYFYFNIGDYRSNTSHLSNEEDLCYRRLIDMYYDREAPIPLDTEWVSRRIRVGPEVVINVLKDFFRETQDGWVNERCDEELAKYSATCDKNRRNSVKGGRPKKRTVKGLKPSGFPLETESKPSRIPNHKPITSNHKPITNNEDGRITEEYRSIRGHSVSVASVRSFLAEGFSQAEIDSVLDSIEQSSEPIKSVTGLMSSWLRRRRDRPAASSGVAVDGVPCRLLTYSEVNQGNLWPKVSMVRIEGRSACRSAGKAVLYAYNTDIEQHGLTAREPKQVGEEWQD